MDIIPHIILLFMFIYNIYISAMLKILFQIDISQ